jgi:WD40 repeat protein
LFLLHLGIAMPAPSRLPSTRLGRVLGLAALALVLPLLAQPRAGADGKGAEAAIKQLSDRFQDKDADKEKLRHDLLAFCRKHGGTAFAVQAARMLHQLPSPLDKLDADKIPALDRFDWQPKELVAVLGEHRGRQGAQVNSVAWSGDGKYVASGGGNGLVRLWDPKTLRQQKLLGSAGATLSLAFSRDGTCLASGNSNGTLSVWDFSGTEPKLKANISIASSPVHSVAFTPDGKKLAIGVYDNVVRVYDVSETEVKESAQLSGHQKGVQAVAFSPDGKTLTSGSADGVLRLWDVTKDDIKERAVVEGPAKAIASLAFMPDGKTLAAGVADGTVWTWNPAGAKPARRGTPFKAHANGVTALAYSPNGKTLATAGPDGIRLWDGSRERAFLQGHAAGVTSLAFAPDSNTLATGSMDWTTRLWNLGGAKPIERYPPIGHLARPNAVSFSPDGRSLASGGEDLTTRVWDVSKAEPAQTALFKGDSTAIYALAFSPDNRTLATGGASTKANLWDTSLRRHLRTLGPHPTHVYSVFYSSDGDRILTRSGKDLVLWNANNGREVARFDGHETPVLGAALSGDGRFVLSGTGYPEYDKDGKPVKKNGVQQYVDCLLRVWDVENGRLLHAEKDFPRPVASVALSPDGRRITGCISEEAPRQWEFSGEKVKEAPEQKEASVGAHVQLFSPDGTRLATVGQDYRVVLCDPASGKRLWEWSPGETVAGLAFSSDSRYLAVSIQTGPVYVLRLDGIPTPP